MNGMKSILYAALCATAAAGLGSAAHADKLADVLARGKLIVGTGSTNPPWHFEDDSGVLLPVNLYREFDDFEPEDFNGLNVGFAGTALCHDGKDLQISIAGMISASQPLMAMAASVIASRNGRQSSTAKAEAARANGRKGGRPRKMDPAS